MTELDWRLRAARPHPDRRLGAREGPLAEVTFAVKDIFDVAGAVTGRGNADWLTSQRPAAANAPAVDALLDAGAQLVGKTITEELAFSVVGINPYYGAPRNVAAPGRVPAARRAARPRRSAARLGPTRLGQRYRRLGPRPSELQRHLRHATHHGRISLDGVMPLAPSFDTVGWFARDAGLFATAGRVLLGEPPRPGAPDRVLIATDAFARLEPGSRGRAAAGDRRRSRRALGAAEPVIVSDDGLDAWYDDVPGSAGREGWAGAWRVDRARAAPARPLLQERVQSSGRSARPTSRRGASRPPRRVQTAWMRCWVGWRSDPAQRRWRRAADRCHRSPNTRRCGRG